MSGSVNPGGNFRRSECDQANPFVMKFTSYNSKCATQKEASIYLTDVTAEPFKFTGPTTDEKGMFEFKIR